MYDFQNRFESTLFCEVFFLCDSDSSRTVGHLSSFFGVGESAEFDQKRVHSANGARRITFRQQAFSIRDKLGRCCTRDDRTLFGRLNGGGGGADAGIEAVEFRLHLLYYIFVEYGVVVFSVP